MCFKIESFDHNSKVNSLFYYYLKFMTNIQNLYEQTHTSLIYNTKPNLIFS